MSDSTERDPFLDFLNGKPKSEVTGAEEKAEARTDKQEEQEDAKEETPDAGKAQEDGDKPKQEDPEKKEEPKTEINYTDALKQIAEEESTEVQDEKKDSISPDKDQWKKFFDTEDEYKEYVLQKELKKKGLESLKNINSLSPKERIIKRMLDEYGSDGMTRDGAIEALAEKYNVDADELFEKSHIIARESKEAREYFDNKINAVKEGLDFGDLVQSEKAEISLDEKQKLDSQNKEKVFKQTIEQWNNIGKEIVKDKTATTIKEKIGDTDFEYVMEESFVEKMPDLIKQVAEYNKLDLTEENLIKVVKKIKADYKAKNFNKIAKAAIDQRLADELDKQSRDIDNPRIKNDKQTSSSGKERSLLDYIN